MKEKRFTRSATLPSNNSKILRDNLNLKLSTTNGNFKNKCRKRSSDISSFDSNNSSIDLNIKDVIENVPPPIATRLRSKKSFKVNGYDYETLKNGSYQFSESSSSLSDDLKSPNNPKKMKLSRNNSLLNSLSVTKYNDKTKISLKSPSNKKISRTHSLLKCVNSSNDLPPPSTRYLLRSRSFKALPSPSLNIIVENVFRAPDPPVKPLSEIYKKSIPNTSTEKDHNMSLSQLSDCSNNSSTNLSTLLSRFVKKKSKLPNAKSSKPWKQMRKMESSQECNDSSSCTSIGEDSLKYINLNST